MLLDSSQLTLDKPSGIIEKKSFNQGLITNTFHEDIGAPRVQGMERIDAYPNSRVFSLGVNIML